MKSQLKALVVGSMTALVGMLSPATVLANGVCYAVTELGPGVTTIDGGPPLIVRYIASNVGSINSDAETRAPLYHLKQQAYSLVGKGTALFEENGNDCTQGPCTNNAHDQFRLMTTLDGTIITGKLPAVGTVYPDSPGSHMGLNVHLLRFVEGPASIGPITLECTSDEAKTAPESWVCNFRLEAQEDVFFTPVIALLTLPIILYKVNPREVPACSVFEDSDGDLPIGFPPPV